MSMRQIFSQFCQGSPLPVMARLALEHASSDELLDQLFARHAQRQVSGELLFSSVVKLMTLVACRVRPSVNAAYVKQGEAIGVSLQALYGKLRGIEPQVSRALVRDTAQRLGEVAQGLNAGLPVPFPGYVNRVLDGAHLAATEHRLGELRKIAAGPLPGLGLCVLDPARQMIVDFIPCRDAYTQERRLLEAIIDDLQPGQVWIADRNFCTAVLVWEMHVSQAFFVIREHAQNVCWEAVEAEEQACGRVETGAVFEQPIKILDDAGNHFVARRVRVVLDTPVRDGGRELTILSNLPAEISAAEIAQGYRRRWTIETAFATVQKCLEGEIRGLGYPGAALFSYAVALLSFNLLNLLRCALRAAHGSERIEETFSTHHMAEEIGTMWGGLTLLLPSEFWRQEHENLKGTLADKLRQLAAQVNLKQYRKTIRTSRKPPPKRHASKTTPHVSTQRIIDQRK